MIGDEIYYDIDGKPMSQEDWLSKFADMGYKQVARTTISLGDNDRVTVSTVWLGLDHNWLDGPPLIFETMIFGLGEKDTPRDDDEFGYEPCYRYSTKEDALRGHDACVKAVRRGQNFNDFDPFEVSA